MRDEDYLPRIRIHPAAVLREQAQIAAPKALEEAVRSSGVEVKPETLTGIAVPFVILGMWLMVRAIRNRHAEEDKH